MLTKRRLSRRGFLKRTAQTLGALSLPSAVTGLLLAEPARFRGSIVGASSKTGHLLRSGNFPQPTTTIEKEFVVIGGGIAGLSAARRLLRGGAKDVLLLELEEEVGGNSRSGRNSVSAYPWGAHYLPIPSPDAHEIVALLEELGVITGHDHRGLPLYNELYLSQDPEERIFSGKSWQKGLIPRNEFKGTDEGQFEEFFAAMDRYRAGRGADGRRLFSIPVDLSSDDADTRALDKISMAAFLARQGWDSPRLQWYVNYCCRDDYGGDLHSVSAWAGIHYFASRDGHGANTVSGNVLTWPEGNGWLVQKLREGLAGKCRTGAVVFNVASDEHGVHTDYFDPVTGASTRVSAKAAIFCAPRFVAARVIESYRKSPPAFLQSFEYSPWMVANLTLRSPLRQRQDAPLSWDNVLYDSPSLGYVNASHQKIERYPRETVLTYYQPLSHAEPKATRKVAFEKSYQDWATDIITDLSKAHPDLRSKLASLDVWLWGHGMIRPTVGFIWGEDRRSAQAAAGPVFFAHTDMSGISIFEEAYHRGISAAEQALRHARKSHA